MEKTSPENGKKLVEKEYKKWEMINELTAKILKKEITTPLKTPKLNNYKITTTPKNNK